MNATKSGLTLSSEEHGPERLVELAVRAEDEGFDFVSISVVHGPDLDPLVDQVERATRAGVDHVYFHQIGPDQEAFLRVWKNELAPRLRAGTGSSDGR